MYITKSVAIIFLSTMIGFVLGVLLSFMGYSFDTWQFWAVLFCVFALALLNSEHDVR